MRVRVLTVAAVVAVAGCSLAACDPAATGTTSSKTTAAAAPPKAAASTPAAPAASPAKADGATADVEVVDCKVDSAIHWPSADLKITNHTSKSSNYMVSVEFTDASGTRVAEGIAATNNLAAGQAAAVKAAGTSAVSGEIKCKVTNVTRYAAP